MDNFLACSSKFQPLREFLITIPGKKSFANKILVPPEIQRISRFFSRENAKISLNFSVSFSVKISKKYTNNKYQFEENVDLTKRQQKEMDDILISNPNEALEKCYEYLENYRRGNSLIYAGAILHLLLKNNIEGYIGHLTLGQKIEDYTNSMLEYEDFYPIIKLKNSNEYYVIMALGGEQIDYDNLQEVMLKNGKLGRFLPYEDEYLKVAKLKDLLTPETKMAINKFTPDNIEKEKTLGELLRTKEIIIKSREEDDLDK